MKTPFTTEQFFSVFEKYNHAIFPVQIILFLLSILALIAIGSTIRQKDKFVAGILGVLWLWMGIGYHIAFFSGINNVAYGFGLLFILQGLFILWEGIVLYNLKFAFKLSIQAVFGYVSTIRWYGVVFASSTSSAYCVSSASAVSRSAATNAARRRTVTAAAFRTRRPGEPIRSRKM